MSNFKEKIENLLDTIKDGAIDMTSLEVTTINGDINPFIDTEGKMDVSKVREELRKTVFNTNDLKVVAHTRMDFDQDAVVIAKENMTPDELEMFDFHQEMMKTARTSRVAFFHFIEEILDDKI